MKTKKKKSKAKLQTLLWMLPYLLIGGLCGWSMTKYLENTENFFFAMALLLVWVYVSVFAQIIIHEAGHLVFGLASGYKFSSFRIASLMIAKINGKLCLKKLALAGTAGQCLMNPPDMKDGRIPYVMYNLGGSILNLIATLVFGALYFIFPDNIYLSPFFMPMALIGLAFALMNGIPMRTEVVDNDGYNALSLGKNKEALRSFWMQMKVSDMQLCGKRLRDMPEEWFSVPSDEDMKNSMVAARGVFACNRLMDEKRFEDADKLMEHLLSIKSGIVGLHRALLVCDRIYCCLVSEKYDGEMKIKLSSDEEKLVKAMKSFPSVMRTEFAVALLHEKNEKKAQDIKKRFEKMAKSYPYVSDTENERELIGLAENINAKV
ncbi:MAG: M50 family metallopeptidase [Clostridia bacterium]|nr:M50 family metallopeptidase [Clostridia bacterium]